MKRFSFLQAASTTIVAAGITAFAVPTHAQTTITPQIVAGTELVTNGGFENDTNDDGNYFAGWMLSGNVNKGVNADTYVFGDPHSGILAAWLGAPNMDGRLSQTLATTPGQTYTVSYWLASDTSTLASAASPLSPQDSPAVFNDFSASFGGQSLITQSNLAPTDGHAHSADDYRLYSFTVVAAKTSSELQFGFRNDPSEFRLDDVSVTNTASAAPEPSATATLSLLLALGLGAAVWKTRRRVKSE